MMQKIIREIIKKRENGNRIEEEIREGGEEGTTD